MWLAYLSSLCSHISVVKLPYLLHVLAFNWPVGPMVESPPLEKDLGSQGHYNSRFPFPFQGLKYSGKVQGSQKKLLLKWMALSQWLHGGWVCCWGLSSWELSVFSRVALCRPGSLLGRGSTAPRKMVLPEWTCFPGGPIPWSQLIEPDEGTDPSWAFRFSLWNLK